ncbi:MAG: MFS transporter, partial [Verrucomicrobia bacterium]|nr:MFS transporter [Verrucomicrobiota bacterium]
MNATPSSPSAHGGPVDSARLDSLFRYWQIRTLIATMFGYAAFYFVRKNLSFAMPAMQSDLGITKADLGIFLTLHGLLYGVSRFVNGMWADRANARYFMVAGL